LTLIALAGCSGEDATPPEEKAVTEEGVDAGQNPLGALGALQDAAGDLEQLQKELESSGPAEPVHFSALLKALPDAPSGWQASEPRGATNQMGDFSMSTASREYTSEGKRMEIEIADWAYHQALYAPFIMGARFSQESTEGYNKGIKIGEHAGRDEYRFSDKSGQRSVLYNRRYFVSVKGQGVEPAAFDEWWGLVKTSELPAVKP
jgi:hypothetical protein